ncbi:MAG: serine hydrolase domain-containing protein [Burkholderiaceae bacterium]
MTEGTTAPRFAAVRDAFEQNLADGLEHGGAVAVWLDGQPVVDLWGGTRDLADRVPWQRDTLVNVWSVGKGVVALAVAMLVERGKLDYAAPVAQYWPEFAANGKQDITVDQVMSHQAGLDGLPVPVSEEQRQAWYPVIEVLQAMKPHWPPGSVCVYHPETYGYLAGELVRRVDGRSIGRFVAQEIAEPLAVSFFFGLPESQDHRVAQLSASDEAYDWVRQGAASAYPHAYRNREFSATAPNERGWRAAEMPAGNGHSDARSLAKIYGALAAGGIVDGHQLIGRRALARAVAERFHGVDASSGAPTIFGAGFRIGAIGFGPHVGDGHFGHTGWGGSVAFADPARGLGFAYVTNRMLGFDHGVDPRRARLLDAVYAALA